ncbi:MAG: isoprenylcysteine carboxyl methyltransferase [Rhizobacter sp.]|nr:isoprenylcysteine carboxyl methyltransferase [Chlorobiales bacterium]
MWFWILIGFLIVQRLTELVIAKRNEIYIKSLGGVEAGGEHYTWMVLLHTSWFVSMIAEHLYFARGLNEFWLLWFGLFLVAQAGRFHVITTLGKFWNTRILIVPGSARVRTGLYKYLKHPNYLIVRTEILVVPLMFGLYFTAGIFSVLNLWMLRVRVREEELALQKLT